MIEFNVSNKKILSKKNKKIILFVGITVFTVLAYIMSQKIYDCLHDKDDNCDAIIDTTAPQTFLTYISEYSDRDFDNDGLNNSEENKKGTDMWNNDTDDDGVIDSEDDTPLKYSDEAINIMTKKLKDTGSTYKTPYKLCDCIVWADNIESRTFGGCVKTLKGYRFTKFKGRVDFGEDKYAYKIVDGRCELLNYDDTNKVWFVDGNSVSGLEVILSDIKYDEYYSISFLDNSILAKKSIFTNILSLILPQKGYLTSNDVTEYDITPSMSSYYQSTIRSVNYNKDDLSRLLTNSNNITDLTRVKKEIDKNYCVAVSLFSEDKGEFIGIVYGYTKDGYFLIADKDTLSPMGTITIEEHSIYQMVGNDLVERLYFDFTGFGFNSKDGARISFFSADTVIEDK